MATLRRAKKSRRTTSRRSKQQRFKARIKSRLWRAKKKLGEAVDYGRGELVARLFHFFQFRCAYIFNANVFFLINDVI